jgi:hypothetical protein
MTNPGKIIINQNRVQSCQVQKNMRDSLILPDSKSGGYGETDFAINYKASLRFS